MADPLPTCVWSETPDGHYETACGEAHVLITPSGPVEHGMRFCCYCGKPLQEVYLRLEVREVGEWTAAAPRCSGCGEINP